MRIENRPRVYLIGRTELIRPGLDQFLIEMNLKWPTPTEGVKGSETIVETAGRCCYMSFGSKAGSKTNFNYIQNLLGRNPDGTFRHGPAHGAVLEHPVWNFIIVGAGRGWSHEQVRNRAGWAYSQLSTRYCDFEGKDDDRIDGDWEPGWCIPPLGQLSKETSAHFEKGFAHSLELYEDAVDMIMRDVQAIPGYQETMASMSARERERALRKAARGAARDLLMNATEAIMVMSCNARGLWNTIALRASRHAEAVIRDVYVQITRIMEVEMPSLFHGIKYQPVWDGIEEAILPRDHI